MKKHYIVYTEQWRRSPMSFWVHIETDNQPWFRAKTFHPPLPGIVSGRGYPYYFVEYDGFTFEFASLAELEMCISVLGQRLLPSTEKETTRRGTGPGLHWLNKLPGHVRPWRYREKAVKYLRHAKAEFEQQINL